MASELKTRIKEDLLLTLFNGENVDGVIVINGCQKACAMEKISFANELPSFSVVSQDQWTDLLGWIESIKKEEDLNGSDQKAMA